jgi:hypothetical protein
VAISGGFALVAKHPEYVQLFGPPTLFHRGPNGWEEIGELRDVFPPDRYTYGIPVRMWGDRAIVGSAGDFEFGTLTEANIFNLNACECLADFDGSGAVNTRDVIVFLNAWVSHHPEADFNNDSQFDAGDIPVFLDTWNAGC